MVRGASTDVQLEKVAKQGQLVRTLKDISASSIYGRRSRILEGEGDS